MWSAATRSPLSIAAAAGGAPAAGRPDRLPPAGGGEMPFRLIPSLSRLTLSVSRVKSNVFRVMLSVSRAMPRDFRVTLRVSRVMLSVSCVKSSLFRSTLSLFR